LPAQHIGGDNHHATVGLIEQGLPDDQSRLDRLTETDFVGQQVALDRIA
jgi:hypothetical protein